MGNLKYISLVQQQKKYYINQYWQLAYFISLVDCQSVDLLCY